MKALDRSEPAAGAAAEPVLVGRRVTLRRFGPDRVHARYLTWLNDPTVNAYSRRGDGPPTGEAEARAYLGALRPGEIVFAIEHREHGHVGNVKYGPIDPDARRADISIVIGEPAVWGQGIGAESIYLVTRYLFDELGLNRVDAGTRNPAFVRLVEKLGWKIEGIRRRFIRSADGWHDQVLVAQLAEEFVRRPEYEAAEVMSS